MSEPYENKILRQDVYFPDKELYLDVELVGGGSGILPYYTGDYEVDPRKVAQTLETKDRSMSEDVVVKEIYYAETSNASGGYTAYIGME